MGTPEGITRNSTPDEKFVPPMIRRVACAYWIQFEATVKWKSVNCALFSAVGVSRAWAYSEKGRAQIPTSAGFPRKVIESASATVPRHNPPVKTVVRNNRLCVHAVPLYSEFLFVSSVFLSYRAAG